MTKLTRTIQWNSGVMLGWKTNGRRMDEIIRQPTNNAKQIVRENDADLFPGIRVITDNPVTSSFFPNNPSGNSVNKGDRIKQRQLTRPPKRRDYFEPQKDFSPEFLDYLRNITKHDFEHATEEDVQNHNESQSSTVSSDKSPATAADVDTNKSKQTNVKQSRNTKLVDGYQLFTASTSTLAKTSRPATVPRYLSLKESGKKADQNNRNILKRVEETSHPASPPTPQWDDSYNARVQPLTKTKVTPSQVDISSPSENLLEDSSKSGEESVEAVSYSSSFTGPTASLSDSERPSSVASSSGSKRVTFAADVVNYERENKPSKKRKIPRRRRQGFHHPSRGIFVPPDLEIVESTGPTGICRDNPYLNFNQVWSHPAARSTGESSASRVIRQERFHRIMNDLEHAHVHYNRLVSLEQNDYLIHSIFKRYILVLDLALTEGHLTQVEHLLETLSKSIPVLQQNTYYYLYGPKIIKDMQQTKLLEKKDDDHPELILVRYALSRISGPLPRQESADMSIETVLVKMCLELIELVFSQYSSIEFRNALTTVPYTVRQAIILLKELRTSKDAFCYIKWINNSAVQRDYRTILKNLGLLDRYGCKADISQADYSSSSDKSESSSSKSKIKRTSVMKRRAKMSQKPSETVEPGFISRPNSS